MEFNKKIMDSNFPLLEKFREFAPGTYKHCQNVSNMCESIALELDLDVDLLKCAALYHDIGKINNPTYFSENQSDESNMHDSLPPLVSCQLLIKHVGDGVLYLVQEPEIPNEIIPIIAQHHGDTILRSIYNKASNQPENLFRYKCKKPETTEAAILMVVDSVEATSRSIFNNNKDIDDKDFIEKSVNSTIDRLIDDGQLDTMKIGILKVIKKIMIKELESTYHKRVIYEDEKDSKTVAEVKSE